MFGGGNDVAVQSMNQNIEWTSINFLAVTMQL